MKPNDIIKNLMPVEKGNNTYGWESITDVNRYKYEVGEYKEFLRNVDHYASNAEDMDYLSLFIDLLIKEVKYSALLEINRGNSKDRFVYPFDKFDPILLDYDEKRDRVQIDIFENNLISAPWNHARYKKIHRHLQDEEFDYDEQNHIAIYYDYLNLTCAYNGLHSLGIGAYIGEGSIKAERYNVSRIFPYLQVNMDLSFSYNQQCVKNMLKEKRIEPDRFKEKLNTRVYGTDYRLLLIYVLCQRRYFMEHKE